MVVVAAATRDMIETDEVADEHVAGESVIESVAEVEEPRSTAVEAWGAETEPTTAGKGVNSLSESTVIVVVVS